MNIGEKIRNRRKELKLTTRQLAEKIGLTHGAIANIERGDRYPRLETRIKICNYLGLDVESLSLTQGLKQEILSLIERAKSEYNVYDCIYYCFAIEDIIKILQKRKII